MRAWKAPLEINPWPEGGFVASVPSLQGCWVVAATPQDALRDVYEVIGMSISSRIKHGEPLPPDIEELEAVGEEGIRIEVAVAVP